MADPDRPSAYVLIAAGGTGGHTYPAVALAAELASRGHPRESIRFVGGRRGIEGKVVRGAGFEIDLLPGRGLQRRLTITNLKVLADTVAAIFLAFRLVRRLRPVVVVGFGGYASLPCVVAARALRVPTVIHEQDAAPGLANRIATRLGALPAVSLPGTALRGAVVTGNPVRAGLADVVRAPRAGPRIVAIWGGSLGARRINEAALELFAIWRDRSDVSVRHVSGPGDHARVAARLEALREDDDQLDYELVAYEDDMEGLYARASVAVCRAGAGTIAELTATGVPSVLVPLPGAPSDHQTRNARALADAGAALLLGDSDCDGARVDELVSGLLAHPERLEEMGKRARSLGHPYATSALADLVEGHARGR